MSVALRGVLGAMAVCCLSGAGAASAEDGPAFTHNGIEYQSSNGDVRITLGGRLHLDAASIDAGGVSGEDREVRRARLELSARLFDAWRLRVDREFTNGGGWRNVWLSYDASDHLSFKAGNFIAPFSMEDMASSNDSMFMERSMAQALAPSFGMGAGASYQGHHFTLAGGYFSDALDAEDNVQAEKGKGVSARATWSPLERRSQVLHFGVGVDAREFSAGDVRRISSGPEASLGSSIVSTGVIANLDSSRAYNVEAAYSAGPILVEGQFIRSDIGRTAGGDLGFSGYYAQAGWIVTGERHEYSDGTGTFAGPNPRGKWGAVEVAARASSLDLSESAVGGQADNVSGGVNWYLGRNFRLMANYVHAEVDGATPLLDRDVDVIEARVQVNF